MRSYHVGVCETEWNQSSQQRRAKGEEDAPRHPQPRGPRRDDGSAASSSSSSGSCSSRAAGGAAEESLPRRPGGRSRGAAGHAPASPRLGEGAVAIQDAGSVAVAAGGGEEQGLVERFGAHGSIG